jgi:hypothetical protein
MNKRDQIARTLFSHEWRDVWTWEAANETDHAYWLGAADAVLSVLAAAPSEPTVCPTCGSDDPERFDGGCGEDTGQPSGMDIGGHLIYDQPDAFHRLSEETTP